MGINGKIINSNVDPHIVAQLLASMRGNRAQLAKCVNDLEIMRKRTNWTEQDWEYVYSIHRQCDRLRDMIEECRGALREAGVDVGNV